MDRDPAMRVDRLTSMLLDFPGVQAIGTCGTQLVAYQRVQIFGTRGRFEIQIPFNAPPDRPTRLFVDDGSDVNGGGIETIGVPGVRPVHDSGRPLLARDPRPASRRPYPLEDSIQNMRILDALVRSVEEKRWVEVGR